MMGFDFFRRSVELVDMHRRPGQRVAYTIQTNATLLNEDWAALFEEHGFLVGVSIDGPRHLHNAYRADKRGSGSFDRVIAGCNLLRSHDVDVNVLCTVHTANQDHQLDVYRFFRDDLNVLFMQFIPIVERVTETLLPLANLGGSTERKEKRPLNVQAGSLVNDLHCHHTELACSYRERAELKAAQRQADQPYGQDPWTLCRSASRRQRGQRETEQPHDEPQSLDD
jgi:uncharacterized protein